jgi:DNA-binding Xre family transcriptional regulator
MARVIAVGQPFRERVQRALDEQGLGITSPELGVSRETARSLVSGKSNRFQLAVLARLCLNLKITPSEIDEMNLKPLAREMERQLVLRSS